MHAETRFSVTCSIAFSVLIWAGTAWAFNGEEHKLIGDLGADGVAVKQSSSGPLGPVPMGNKLATRFQLALSGSGAEFVPSSKKYRIGGAERDYRATLGYAKQFSVGPFRVSVAQDNCYRRDHYAQDDNNLRIDVPDRDEVPSQVLMVPAYVGSQESMFTFGELVALYGDFRRTTYCVKEKCYLSNKRFDNVFFKGTMTLDKSSIPWEWKSERGQYCPPKMRSDDYLRLVGSGLQPPFGAAANLVNDSADEDEINDAGWWGDELLRLANVNDWHFSDAAVAWYIAMHRLALAEVLKAVKRSDPKYWVRALHYEANGLHALTDIFALGHILVDRSRTAASLIKVRDLGNDRTMKYMDWALAYGGGVRDKYGVLRLTSVPRIAKQPEMPRKDFLATGIRGKGNKLESFAEEDGHTYFNEIGGIVRNVNGDRFRTDGDFKFYEVYTGDKTAADIVAKAVEHSLKSLISAYVELKDIRDGKTSTATSSSASSTQSGGSSSTPQRTRANARARLGGAATRKNMKRAKASAKKSTKGADMKRALARRVSAIGRGDGEFFRALKYIPIFVEKDGDGFFKGRFTGYARAVYELVGETYPKWKATHCTLEPMSGYDVARIPARIPEGYGEYVPNLVVRQKPSKACTQF